MYGVSHLRTRIVHIRLNTQWIRMGIFGNTRCLRTCHLSSLDVLEVSYHTNSTRPTATQRLHQTEQSNVDMLRL